MGDGNREKDCKMEARHRILRYLSGQLEAAVVAMDDKDPGCWLGRDSKGDRLSDHDRAVAKAEAESICDELGVMTAFRIQTLL